MNPFKIEWRTPGVGFLPCTFPHPYDRSYWEEYRRRDMGYRLTKARAELVRKYSFDGDLVDVGIGGGAFVEEMGCKGIDICCDACMWLKARGADWHVECDVDALTFWDSLEHLEVPSQSLNRCRKFVFVSTPIYESEAAVEHSKHFKPGEHLWYFTDEGLKAFMVDHGFECVEQNLMESDLGREGIGTYVFRRIAT